MYKIIVGLTDEHFYNYIRITDAETRRIIYRNDNIDLLKINKILESYFKDSDSIEEVHIGSKDKSCEKVQKLLKQITAINLLPIEEISSSTTYFRYRKTK